MAKWSVELEGIPDEKESPLENVIFDQDRPNLIENWSKIKSWDLMWPGIHGVNFTRKGRSVLGLQKLLWTADRTICDSLDVTPFQPFVTQCDLCLPNFDFFFLKMTFLYFLKIQFPRFGLSIIKTVTKLLSSYDSIVVYRLYIFTRPYI